jgi:crotonobetainyl-CoA:carnitine CoA-transferase CaiB-like acyl-CoA transferase
VTHEDRVVELFDDPDLQHKGWLATYQHPLIGRVVAAGLLFDFSETPGRLWGPSPLVGQHSREILTELGYQKATIDSLIATGAVGDASEPTPG